MLSYYTFVLDISTANAYTHTRVHTEEDTYFLCIKEILDSTHHRPLLGSMEDWCTVCSFVPRICLLPDCN